MDIVKPNGDSYKDEAKKDEQSEQKEEEKPKEQLMHAKFDEEGYVTIRANIAHISTSHDLVFMLRGFLDYKRDQILNMITQLQLKAEEQKAKITTLNNKNGHRNFINKLWRR